MFSRSKKRSNARVVPVKKQATITIIKPEQENAPIEEPPLDLSTAKISMIKPDGLMIQVDEVEGEED